MIHDAEGALVARYKALKLKQKDLGDQITTAKQELVHYQKRDEILRKARWLFLEVARVTQETFKEKVENLQTLAIRSVFDRPFTFELRFDQSRNAATCTPIIKEGELELTGKADMGGGMIDLVSITLRFILWSLSKPQTRRLIILDEPLKFIGKGPYLQKAGQMFRELSHRMKFQLIILTHEPELAEIADKAYHVTHDGKKSTVEILMDSKKTTRKLKKRKAKNA